jgi:hypothetical protein
MNYKRSTTGIALRNDANKGKETQSTKGKIMR